MAGETGADDWVDTIHVNVAEADVPLTAGTDESLGRPLPGTAGPVTAGPAAAGPRDPDASQASLVNARRQAATRMSTAALPVLAGSEWVDTVHEDVIAGIAHPPDAGRGGRSAAGRDGIAPAARRHPVAYLEMLLGSALGLIASFVLSVDALELARNPAASFTCDISARISCSTVGSSWQASLLGFPNAFLGLVTEPVIITLAVALLAGTRLPRWFMVAAQAVSLVGLGFAYWLFYQAYFDIGALCPWCLLVTVTTTVVFASLARVNLLDNNFGLSPGAHERASSWLRAGADTWVAAIAVAVVAAMVVYGYA